MQSIEHFNIDISPLSSIGIHLEGGGGGLGTRLKHLLTHLLAIVSFRLDL